MHSPQPYLTVDLSHTHSNKIEVFRAHMDLEFYKKSWISVLTFCLILHLSRQHASYFAETEASPNSRLTNGNLQSRFHQGKVFITKNNQHFLLLSKDIAESLNITLPETVASSLASDVEYRINQVIEVRF